MVESRWGRQIRYHLPTENRSESDSSFEPNRAMERLKVRRGAQSFEFADQRAFMVSDSALVGGSQWIASGVRHQQLMNRPFHRPAPSAWQCCSAQ
jgi:hypothetical protein